jgi:hypothetical protein
VDSKFGGSWCGVMKNIRSGWGKFSSHTRFKVGEGFNFRLWHDLWCGDLILKEAFPVLYGIACANDAFVVAHLELSSGSNKWNVSFARAAHDSEMAVFASFFRVKYSVSVRWKVKISFGGSPPK